MHAAQDGFWRAVLKLLRDPEWLAWSDREIAKRCGVDHMTVGKLRPPKLSGEDRQINPKRKVSRGGMVFEQNTDAINAGYAGTAELRLPTAIHGNEAGSRCRRR
jgi:hypothetical protein